MSGEREMSNDDWLLAKMHESLDEAHAEYLKWMTNDVRSVLSTRQTLEIVLSLMRPKLGLPKEEFPQG